VALAREGHCFDTDLPEGYWERLRAWMIDNGQWNEAFFAEKDQQALFALDFVRSNVPSAFLYRQYREAREGVDGGYCLGSHDREGRCLGCGACASEEQRAEIVRKRQAEPQTGTLSALRSVMQRKRRLKPAHVRLRLDRRLAGAGPAFLNAAVLRGLLARHPELTGNLLSARESLFTVAPNDRRFPPLTGETVFALKAWDVKAVLYLLDRSRDFPIASDKGGTLCDWEIAATDLGFEVLGPAVGFASGAYARLQLEIRLPAAHFPEPRVHLERYLRAAYLPYSLRRETPQQGGEARFSLDVPAKGIRKKIAFGGAFELDAGGMTAWLEVGPGFDALAFLESFEERGLYRQAGVCVAGIEW
jgi:hypothetical protein